MLHAILFSLATPPSAPPPSPDAPSCLSTENQAVWLQRANDGTTDYPAAQYVILSLYLLLLLGLVVAARLIALRRNEQNEAEHFLAGRSLGPITLGFSVCASMFSGYTVVGIPAEAYTAGFSAWRWIGSCTFISVVYLSYAPRLHWLSRERKYDSLLSFVWDRYGVAQPHKDWFHWLVVLVLLFPSFIYFIAQIDAFANTFNQVSNGRVPTLLGGAILSLLVVLFEFVGGLRAVAFTDVIQGAILVTGAMLILWYVGIAYPGLPAISSCLQAECSDHVTVMDAGKSLSWAEFWIGVGFQRALFPDYMQRVIAARDQATMRKANIILAVAPFFIQGPLAIYGLIGRIYHPGATNAKSVFSKVVLDVISHDTSGAIFGSAMMAATIAAIMSTADSVLVALSFIVSLDVIRPFREDVHASRRQKLATEDVTVKTDGGASTKSYITRLLVPTILVIIAYLISIPVLTTNFSLSFLIQFQSSILANTAPLFIGGLYLRILDRYSVSCGLIVGMSIGMGLVANKVPGGILISLASNLVITTVTALLLKLKRGTEPPATSPEHAALLRLVSWRPPTGDAPPPPMASTEGGRTEVDAKAPPLTLSYTPCTKEPLVTRPYMLIAAAVCAFFAVPFYRESGMVDQYVGGVPVWALRSLLVLALMHSLIIVVICCNWSGENTKTSTDTESIELADRLAAA